MDFNAKLLAGLDEAGRGPLAGPVSAGAVVLPPDFPFEILNDSKKHAPKNRALAAIIIKEKACWAVALVSHEEIDAMNILRASMEAMRRAFSAMKEKLPLWAEKNGLSQADLSSLVAIADGNTLPPVDCEVHAVVKADAKYPCVMAASILAKEERDRIMVSYDALYPGYGYAKHKGYPTKAHKAALAKLGPSPIQRKTFTY